PMKISLAIIDDEAKIRLLLRDLIRDRFPDYEVVGEGESVQQAHAMIVERQPQALLLDVQMNDGTGFDLLDQLEQPPHVIFVTAFDHYAVQALRASAVDYLEKPIDPVDLSEALHRLALRIREDQPPQFADVSRHLLQGRIAVPTRNGLAYVDDQRILYVRANGPYSHLHLQDEKKPMIISRTLKSVQETLEKRGFVRVHHSYLVNAARIQEVSRIDGGFVLLSDGEQIPFSRQYKEDAMDRIKQMTLLL
ncbi:MAG: LytTR family DNA-binding domain-containing protein, partial [Bacteroidota bacterium]